MQSTSPVSLNGRNHPAPVRFSLPRRERTVFLFLSPRSEVCSMALKPFIKYCNSGIDTRTLSAIKPLLALSTYLLESLSASPCGSLVRFTQCPSFSRLVTEVLRVGQWDFCRVNKLQVRVLIRLTQTVAGANPAHGTLFDTAIGQLIPNKPPNLCTLRALLPVLLSFWNSLSNARIPHHITGYAGLLARVNGRGYAHNG